jgi:enamine deaminase RidA (YjgF/YER057c/UK114 family)
MNKEMILDIRSVESETAAEFYVTAVSTGGQSPDRQAQEVYETVRELLKDTRARIFQERVFTAQDNSTLLLSTRAAALGDFEDGVPPTVLAVPVGPNEPVWSTQIHMMRSKKQPHPIVLDGNWCGRFLEDGTRTYAALSGLAAPEVADRSGQARSIFEKADRALQTVGSDLGSIVRTWLWLGDILAWYDDFNAVRNALFREKGIFNGTENAPRFPASTGIGVHPVGPAACALDAFAVFGEGRSVAYHAACGHQNCAYDYGSAFSRAAEAVTPAGRTVFVSGTAAIDSEGRTEYPESAVGQIEATIAHVHAVLRDWDCRDQDVVQAIIYCTTPEVRAAFDTAHRELNWPCVVVLGDICRTDLLFEVEVTALPGARSL